MSLGPASTSLNPDQADNFEDVRYHPAKFLILAKTPYRKADKKTVLAVQHMTTYWAILEKMKGSSLRLTKFDDDIFEHFKKEFPDFDPKETIDEEKMKSKEGKERWRNFMMAYEKTVDDYNFGTMLRSNPKFEYGEKETIFGTEYFVPIAHSIESGSKD
ncbi:hypothetical protein ACLMJK_006132 [Lecanora helva]